MPCANSATNHNSVGSWPKSSIRDPCHASDLPNPIERYVCAANCKVIGFWCQYNP